MQASITGSFSGVTYTARNMSITCYVLTMPDDVPKVCWESRELSSAQHVPAQTCAVSTMSNVVVVSAMSSSRSGRQALPLHNVWTYLP